MSKQNRRDLFHLAGAGALASLAIPTMMAKLPDMAKSADGAKITQEPFGELRVYFDGATDQLKAMTSGSLKLKAGMEPHPPHQHPEEEIMVVTEGTGEIMVAGKVTKAGPGVMMYCAANKLHGVKSTGETPLVFYYFKWKV